jgi:7-cyano-7-deazaguanine synthase
VHALTFAYGQRHAREIEAARWQAAAAGVVQHHIIDIGFFGPLLAGSSALTDARRPVPSLHELRPGELRQPPTYVPNRNMVLLSLAAAYAEGQGIRDVFYGAQAQDRAGYWDCSAEFVQRLNAALALNRGAPVRIYAPFAGWRKTDALRLGLDLGVDYARTWTCYRGADRPCGTCTACVERATAFRELGRADPLESPAVDGTN